MTGDDNRRDRPRAVVLVVDDHTEITLFHLARPEIVDLGVIDSLASLQLAARRLGWAVRVDDPCPTLRGLIELVGLGDVLLRRQVRGETELGEQLRVEEVVQPGDPSVG